MLTPAGIFTVLLVSIAMGFFLARAVVGRDRLRAAIKEHRRVTWNYPHADASEADLDLYRAAGIDPNPARKGCPPRA